MLSDNIVLDDSWTTASERNTANPVTVGRIIERSVPVAKDAAGMLYYYEGGIYKPKGEQLIAELYRKWLTQYDRVTDWKAKRSQDIVEFIGVNAKELRDRPPLHEINLLNGIWNWEQGTFGPHTPDYLSTIQIPIIYDPNATCPRWDSFLQEILPYPGGANYLCEVIGMCMIPFMGIQKSIILVGSGSNGKSTYLNALSAAIGEHNISNIPLHVLTSPTDRFSKSGIVGKLVNIFGDLSPKRIEDASNFKALVGEDRITIEYKHRSPFYYRPFCKLIFSCNEVVKSEDESDGYKRRFIHIPFTQRFAVDPQKGLELQEALSQPQELSGLLNKILPTIPNVVDRGLTLTHEIAGIIDDWCPISEETKHWLETNIVYDPKWALPMSAFYTFFCEHCPITGDITRTKMVQYLKHVFPECKPGKTARWKTKTFRSIHGLRLASPELTTTLYDRSFDEKELTA